METYYSGARVKFWIWLGLVLFYVMAGSLS